MLTQKNMYAHTRVITKVTSADGHTPTLKSVYAHSRLIPIITCTDGDMVTLKPFCRQIIP